MPSSVQRCGALRLPTARAFPRIPRIFLSSQPAVFTETTLTVCDGMGIWFFQRYAACVSPEIPT